MQYNPIPDTSVEVKERVAAAEKVLYTFDEEGNIIGKTNLYKNYLANLQALATAKSNLAAQFALAQRDPAKFEVWPVQSATFQQAVDDARNALLSEGADRVKHALDVIGSVGKPMR